MSGSPVVTKNVCPEQDAGSATPESAGPLEPVEAPALADGWKELLLDADPSAGTNNAASIAMPYAELAV
jgi:hypothetical protein